MTGLTRIEEGSASPADPGAVGVVTGGKEGGDVSRGATAPPGCPEPPGGFGGHVGAPIFN
jgi:hypothetical protein